MCYSFWLYSNINTPRHGDVYRLKGTQAPLVGVIRMMPKWARWRLKSPASRLFTQPFIQGADQRKHQSSASLAFVRGIHRWPMNSPHKWPVTRKMFPVEYVIMVMAWLMSNQPSGTHTSVTFESKNNNIHHGEFWRRHLKISSSKIQSLFALFNVYVYFSCDHINIKAVGMISILIN